VDETFLTSSAEDVRALIAALWLGPPDSSDRIGDIRLAPHQVTAISRIRVAFAEFGGALLCDVVGSGKTYIGAAIASEARNALIIAPASLRPMWMEALRQTKTDARFITIESLSRSAPARVKADTIVIDEAHHFRNAATIRRRHLADLICGRTVLMMTATPIHNSRRDLDSLFALFLGARAAHLTDADLASLVVRRDKTQIVCSAPIPDVRTTEWLPVGDDGAIANAILALPPPVPPRDSGSADALVAHGLVRQWASSEAALQSAVQRRLARAAALEASLDVGDYPSVVELGSWMSGDDSIQLGFAGLLAPHSAAAFSDLLAAVRMHATALRRLVSQLKSVRTLDDERAARLCEIRSRHPSALIVAFSSYEATVRMLFEILSRSERVAMLTSRGGRVAGGRVSRAEIIEQFSPGGPIVAASDRIDLLLTTDLLSEGVNLQKAEVVIHLDLPWTPARIEQRVGRLARVGSHHSQVSVYGLAPPPSAERILSTSELLGAKWRAACAALGREHDLGLGTVDPPLSRAPSESHEAIRSLISCWHDCGINPHENEKYPVVAAIEADEPGFVALIERNATFILIGTDGSKISESPVIVERVCQAANGKDASVDEHLAELALACIEDWMTARDASETAGLGSSAFLRTRRQMLGRIDAATSHTPVHERASRARLFDRARASVTSTRNAAEEKMLDQILRSPDSIGDNRWLEEVAAIGTRNADGGNKDRRYRIRAILLLVDLTPPPSS
jgi:superfamily II DNA or RNA helicase